MANIYFKCSCDKTLAVDEAGAGRVVNCPDCGKPVTIPEPKIEWECSCGKTMLAPANMAGQTVQCVDCNGYVEIPAMPRQDRSPVVDSSAPVSAPPQRKEAGVQVLRKDATKSFPLKPLIVAASVVVVCGIGIAGWKVMGNGSGASKSAPQASASLNPPDPANQPAAVEKPAGKSVADAKQQLEMGNKYSDAKDFSRAVECFRKSADQGNPVAQYNLGLCYADGDGVAKDETKAAEFIRKSAEQGHARAQAHLGGYYLNGIGVAKDFAKAAEWYRKGAERGDAGGQFMYGVCCENGTGVEANNTEAVSWYRKAANQGYDDAKKQLAALENSLKQCDTCKKDAEQGNAEAQFRLGTMYFEGISVKRDGAKAIEWWTRAAEQDNADAQSALGNRYYVGDIVPKNPSKAFELISKAAKKGNADALYNLGVMYDRGEGVAQNFKTAIALFRQAAEKGQPNGCHNIASCYYTGEGVEKNPQEAFKWFSKAADQGLAMDQCQVALMLYNGEGVQRDYSMSLDYIVAAARNGDEKASAILKRLVFNYPIIGQSYGYCERCLGKPESEGKKGAVRLCSYRTGNEAVEVYFLNDVAVDVRIETKGVLSGKNKQELTEANGRGCGWMRQGQNTWAWLGNPMVLATAYGDNEMTFITDGGQEAKTIWLGE